MEPMQQLIETHRLHRLKAAYFRFYDTQDWDHWLGLFAEDATLRADHQVMWSDEPPIPPMALIGRQAIRDYVTGVGHLRRTVHHGHTPEIDLLSETEATGIWAMEDIIEYPDRRIHGHGHYHETYRKLDGEWRFASIHLHRLRLTVVALPTPGILDTATR